MNEYPELHLLINGEKIGLSGRQTFDVIDPSNGKAFAELPCASDADLEAALDAAEKGWRLWRETPAKTRADTLRRAASLMRDRTGIIAHAMVQDTGKPLSEAEMELGSAADVVDWHAASAEKIAAEAVPPHLPNAKVLVEKKAIGPVAAFAPWNLPVFLPARKIAAALAAGCSIVIKPAEETPSSSLLMAHCFLDAGVEPKALSMLFGEPAKISSTLIKSPIIRKVSFTGSTEVGRSLGELAGRYLKPITMELGGHAPVLIFEDADIDATVEALVQSKFFHAGQICIAPTRFYIQDPIHDRFVDAFTERSAALKVGHGLSDGVQMGALSNQRRVEAMERHVEDAVQRGSVLKTGGNQIGEAGYFYSPTVIADVPEDALSMNEEPFGPIALTSRFDGVEDAIAKANRLPFGLAAYAFTTSEKIAKTVGDQVEAGMLGLNTAWIAVPQLPFGGVKNSGFGVEGGADALGSLLVSKPITHVST